MHPWLYSNIELIDSPASGGVEMFGKLRTLDSSIMTVEEKKNFRHSRAMSDILATIIEYEDKNGIAMTQEQIVEAFKSSEFNTEVVLFELLDLAYVACSVFVSPEQRYQNVQVKSICYAWGTTFFGREWYNISKTKTEVS
jgi:hypothetical protein